MAPVVNAGEKFGLPEITEIAWRHKFKFLLVFLSIFALAGYLAFALPAVYRSAATLLIEAQNIPQSTIPTTVGGYVEARLASIEQKLLSTKSLIDIGGEAGIIKATSTEEEVINFVQNVRMGMSRETEVIEAPDPRGAASTVSFTVYYEDTDPGRAQVITNQIAKRYIVENSRLRIGLAEGVSGFLKEEADRLNAELKKVEGQIAAFKAENFELLPESQMTNLRSLDKADTTIESLEQMYQQLNLRKYDIERQLKLNERAEGEALLKQVLAAKKQELRMLNASFHDAHPDIIALKSSIENLEHLLASGDAKNYVGDTSAASPVDSNLLITLKSQLKQTESEMESVKINIQTWSERKEEYEERLLTSPEIENQYEDLARERDKIKLALREIDNKQMAARLALQLEIDQKSERFVIIEPASFPEQPYKPNRPALGFLGFILALGAGVITVALAERYSSKVFGVRGVASLIGEPPLAVIPNIGMGRSQR